MKYMVMTTKHHEGFCLWDTQQTDYNAVKHGPGRDLVREYVDACREFGLQVGFYYSLMDWHHPDGARCAVDEAARRRFMDFTDGCVRELMTNYGKIDILWYDVSWPLKSPELWESARRNAMVRELAARHPDQQPLTTGRRLRHAGGARSPPSGAGRNWEACMTFNGSWGYMPSRHRLATRRAQVISMLRTASAGPGNLLLNIGPRAGRVACRRRPTNGCCRSASGWPPTARPSTGQVERDRRRAWNGCPRGYWSIKGNTAYFWADKWPGRELTIGGLQVEVKRASLLATGEEIAFEQVPDRLILKGLRQENPDKMAGLTVIKLECASAPRQVLGAGCVVL